MFWKRRRRDIFEFWDGVKTRRIDPLMAWDKMWTCEGCTPNLDMPAADNGDREAWRRVQAMARDMFGVTAYTEDIPGLTEDELDSVLADFLLFMGGLKKKREASRMRWESMALASSPVLATPPDADSSSTPSESSDGEPSQCSQQ